MNKTRYLQILFDQNFQAYDIPKLRAAIIEKTKRESDLFHNHLDNEHFIYRYPLIQYKIRDKKPCLICLKEATDDIHYLLKHKDFKFNISGKIYDFEIEDVWLRYAQIQTWDAEFKYSVLHYMALNQDNYAEYKKLDSIVDRVNFIQDILEKHINIFAEEMNAFCPISLSVKLLDIKDEKFIEYKGVFHLTFNITFKSNLHIPDYVGIGKGVSIGFGIVRQIDKNAPIN